MGPGWSTSFLARSIADVGDVDEVGGHGRFRDFRMQVLTAARFDRIQKIGHMREVLVFLFLLHGHGFAGFAFIAKEYFEAAIFHGHVAVGAEKENADKVAAAQSHGIFTAGVQAAYFKLQFAISIIIDHCQCVCVS